eukprot:182279-Rhodomonas_salina.1
MAGVMTTIAAWTQVSGLTLSQALCLTWDGGAGEGEWPWLRAAVYKRPGPDYPLALLISTAPCPVLMMARAGRAG